MLKLLAHKIPLRTAIEKYACIRVIEEKHTDNHNRVLHRFLVPHFQDPSHASDILVLCLWAVPFEMPRLPTSVTRQTHSSTSGLGGLLSWHLTETTDIPLPNTVVAVHLLESSIVIEVSLVAFKQISSILFDRRRGSRDSGGMGHHILLSFDRLLSHLALFLVLEISLVISPFWLIRCGCHNAPADSVVDKTLCQMFGTVVGGWVSRS